MIVLSGDSTDEFAARIIEVGAARILQKPFDNLELLDACATSRPKPPIRVASLFSHVQPEKRNVTDFGGILRSRLR